MRCILSGTGTSQGVPVIGCNCSVCSSSDPRDQRLRSAALFVHDDGTTVAIDAGPDFRAQMLRAKIRRLDAVVFTHEHKDHTAGLDDVRPFIFKQGRPMDIYATSAVSAQLRQEYAYAFSAQRYPGAPEFQMHSLDKHLPFRIGSIELTPVPVMHGEMPVLGFRCGEFAYLTDLNHIPDSSMELLKGLRFLVLDALHHQWHHSHFNLSQAIEAAHAIGAERTWFTHISHQMGLHDVENAQLPAGMELGYDGLEIEW